MLSVRLESNLEDQLNSLAKKTQVSKSKIIKDSLTYYFDMLNQENKEKSSYELGVEFFGKYSSDCEDLSTTYKQRLNNLLNQIN